MPSKSNILYALVRVAGPFALTRRRSPNTGTVFDISSRLRVRLLIAVSSLVCAVRLKRTQMSSSPPTALIEHLAVPMFSSYGDVLFQYPYRLPIHAWLTNQEVCCFTLAGERAPPFFDRSGSFNVDGSLSAPSAAPADEIKGVMTVLLRAYANNPVQRYVMRPQTR